MVTENKVLSGLFGYLGQTVENILCKVPLEIIKEAREIRFSIGNPIQIVFADHINSIGKSGKFCGRCSQFDSFSGSDIQNIFLALCEYSVHTFGRQIKEGFITVNGGYRAGICGTAVYEDNKIIGVKDISSINIRIPHEIAGVSNELCKLVKYENITRILIVGPPCSGKTTILRDFARQLGNGLCGKDYRVSIIDERMEIAGIVHGKPSFDIGTTTDVFNGYLKSDGIIMAVRTMSPDIIICDEFGGDKEIDAGIYAMKSGASIIASIHAMDKNELAKKETFLKLIKNDIFERVVFMNKSCQIEEIVKAEEFFK